MIIDIHLLTLAIFWFSAIYWSIPGRYAQQRQYFVSLFSALLIYAYSPLVLAVVVLVTLWGIGVYHALRRWPRFGFMIWSIFVPMILLNIEGWGEAPLWMVGSPRSPVARHLVTLGLSFYSVKIYGSVYMALKSGELRTSDLFATTLFFPAFSSGPIDYAEKFREIAARTEFFWSQYLMGIMRVGTGLFKVSLVSGWLVVDAATYLTGSTLADIKSGPWATHTVDIVLAYQALSFLNLYINFSGFTDIAIGAGKMIGVNLTENFRFPLFAHSIQNFWQRWHLSLAGFINKFMFKPMVRRTGHPKIAIVVVFVLVGLWHSYSLGYLLWGLGHGLLLSAHMVYSKKIRPQHTALKVAWRGVSTLLTLWAVSFLSAIANLNESKDIGPYLLAYLQL